MQPRSTCDLRGCPCLIPASGLVITPTACFNAANSAASATSASLCSSTDLRSGCSRSLRNFSYLSTFSLRMFALTLAPEDMDMAGRDNAEKTTLLL